MQGRARALWVGLSIIALVVAYAGVSFGQSAVGRAQKPSPAAPTNNTVAEEGDAGPPAPPEIAAPKPGVAAPQVSSLQRQLEQARNHIAALLSRELDPALAPQSLFDIDLGDEKAIALEHARLNVLLQGLLDAGVKGTTAPSDAGVARAELKRSWTEGELRARLRLDRARFDFYALPKAERSALLEAHRVRQENDRASRVEQQAGEAEQRAMVAERQRLEALAQAQQARTEALRLVAEEQARLLGIAAAQAQFEARLLEAKKGLVLEQEQLLTQQRQVREVLESAVRGESVGNAAAEQYATLRALLRASRGELDVALSELDNESRVPVPGPDKTIDLPAEVDAAAPRAKHAELRAEAERLQRAESEVRLARVDTLFERVSSLNVDRLALYPHLPSEMRDEIVGFGPRGRDQARAELVHVALTLRYSISELRRWLKSIAGGGEVRDESAWAVSAVALKWWLPFGMFFWWRRRAADTLNGLRDSLRTERQLGHGEDRATLETAIGVLQRIRRPAESLLLTLTVVWLLPEPAQARLEIQVAAVVLHWTLGGALAVAMIDAFAELDGSLAGPSRSPNAELRLRSLKLLGRVVVLVALILSLSSELVGKGTVYEWVLSTSWFAAIPVALLISGWWKEQIYERLAQRRRKNALMTWALQQTGWRSLPVALGAGAYFFYEGMVKRIKPIVTSFDVSRKLLAYLFRRDLSKRSETDATAALRPLPNKLFTALGPSTPSTTIVQSVADSQVVHIIERINRLGGGVFALVGERGSGKTTLLRRIASEARDVVVVKCPLDFDELGGCFARAVDAAEDTSLEDCAAIANAPDRDAGLLFDDAHRLLKPTMSGLELFDRLLGAAALNSSSCCWVFAFDQVMWAFLQRARGTKPLFDDVIALHPWGEEAIGRLITSRNGQVGIAPSFEGLLGPLPKDADAIDVREAIDRTRAGYYRLIWDYATGNPGIALHSWRASLALDQTDAVRVQNLRAPDARELETLPDDASFVLRAVVQLEFAGIDDLVAATQLSRAEVLSALRFGIVRGYFEQKGDYYTTTWAWYRPITRFLERRHLLIRR